MKKIIFLGLFVMTITVIVYGQSRQAGQNLLQGFWLKTESRGLSEYSTNFTFIGNKVNVAWDGDAYGEFNFVYENNILTIYESNPSDPFLLLKCIISDNDMILLWDNGWAILEKS